MCPPPTASGKHLSHTYCEDFFNCCKVENRENLPRTRHINLLCIPGMPITSSGFRKKRAVNADGEKITLYTVIPRITPPHSGGFVVDTIGGDPVPSPHQILNFPGGLAGDSATIKAAPTTLALGDGMPFECGVFAAGARH